MASTGPIVLYVGSETLLADVVFVHGLRGDSMGTWSKGNSCWPRDFLSQDLPETRIITWGYDASVAQATKLSSQASIFGHSENLLRDLARLRRKTAEERGRPLIFIGHGLGGLVIKEALIRSSEYWNNKQDAEVGAIYHHTKGLVFLGTPHRGSEKSSLAEVISSVIKIGLQRPNDKLIEVLTQDSQVLEKQMRSFASISSLIPIACVCEELPTGIGVIVPVLSATMDGFHVKTASVPANHMDMCKFSSANDVGYQRISDFVWLFVTEAGKAANVARGVGKKMGTPPSSGGGDRDFGQALLDAPDTTPGVPRLSREVKYHT